MTRIDLIPPELVEQQRARRIIILMAVVFGVVVLAVAFLTGALVVQRTLVSGRLTQIQTEKGKVDGEIAKLKVYEERQKQLDEREKMVKQLSANQVFWSSILNGVSMVIPHDIWLKDLNADVSAVVKAKTTAGAQQSQAKATIKMSGYAFNHSAVARWLVHQSEIPELRDVWLDSSESKTVGTQKLIEFQTTATLTQFATAAGAKK